jgi:hypothetical protein
MGGDGDGVAGADPAVDVVERDLEAGRARAVVLVAKGELARDRVARPVLGNVGIRVGRRLGDGRDVQVGLEQIPGEGRLLSDRQVCRRCTP